MAYVGCCVRGFICHFFSLLFGETVLITFQNVLLTLLALVAGASFVVQQAVNSNLRIELGSAWWAGFFSYLGGTLVMLIMIVCMREPSLSSSLISRSTWWCWSGGVFGAVYITISILLLPQLGAFTVVALIVIGQLATSLVFDHFGILNVPHHPASIARIVGAVFLCVGAVLIRW
jgi:transporter family-2 protein